VAAAEGRRDGEEEQQQHAEAPRRARHVDR
jgi:hypothetical protein